MAQINKTSQITPTSDSVYKLVLETDEAAASGETITVDMSQYGCDTFLASVGFKHSTTDSVVVSEAPTTSVTGSTVTLTIGGTGAAKRVFEVLMR